MKHSYCQLEFAQLLGKTVTETSHPGQVTICMSHFTTGGPGKEHGTHKSLPTGRIGKGRKRRGRASPRVLPESSLLESMSAERWGRPQEGPWVRKIGHRQPETNPLTINPGPRATCGAVLPGPLTPPLSPGAPHPPALAPAPAQWRLLLREHVSPRIIHFWAEMRARSRALEGLSCMNSESEAENTRVCVCTRTLWAGGSHLLGTQTMS